MSEPVAARVEDDTKQWLETRAEQEEITVSKLAGTILDNQSGDVEQNSTEQRLNEIEQDITALKRHAEALELKHFTSTELCTDIELREGTLTFPELPGNDEENVYGNEKLSLRDGSFKKNV